MRAPVQLSRRDAARLGLAPRRPVDPKKQVEGQMARAVGREFESGLNELHGWYDRAGEAAIEKVNPPVEGWGMSLRVGASTVDYVGTVRETFRDAHGAPVAAALALARARGIAFDAKRFSGATFSLAAVRSKRTGGARGADEQRLRRQAEYLRDRAVRHGWLTFFLLYDAEYEVLSVLRDVAAVARGDAVLVRSKPRPTKAVPRPEPVFHLPHLRGAIARAAVPQFHGGRPLLDYLALLRSP